MTSEEIELKGRRGRVVVHSWSRADPRYVVVIAHGYGEHARRYEAVASRLGEHGAAVYALDHIGHGASDGERGAFESVDDLVADLGAVVERASTQQPGLPIVLVGHSLGGIVATRYAQSHGGELAALVLSSPAIGGNPGFEAMLGMDPMPEVPIDPELLSRDQAVVRAYAEDPVVYHGPIKRVAFVAMLRAIDEIRDGPTLGGLPTLWLHGEQDGLAPLAETRAMVERIRGDRLEAHIYPEALHEVFHELNRDDVIDDMLRFLDGTLVAAPARSDA
jgi:alpha-beta hydrolase superfamily lysophospholipase